MKKLLPLIVLALIAVGVVFYARSKGSENTPASEQPGATGSAATSGGNAGSTSADSASDVPNIEVKAPGGSSRDSDGLVDDDARPATDVYKNADDALNAVKEAAKNYDDVVLEQFTELPLDCSWCDRFYKSVSELALSPTSSQDDKSYFAEILAVSGRLDNVKTLVEAIKGAAKPEEADVYSEALEIAIGRDDVVSYLGKEIEGAPDNLRESITAALTNQSSRLAAETLYKHTVERGDADGYYQQGIGLAEFIPNEEALPAFQEWAAKRDQYSHLAVKSLLNSGLDGLRIVYQVLESSKDPEFDRKMLQNAVEHVNYEEAIETIAKEKANSPNPVIAEFSKKILEDFNTEAADDTSAGGADEDQN